VLSGSWGQDQTVQATVYAANQPDSDSAFEEVELRLRTTIAADEITGYEINFSTTSDPYIQIVRWDGALDDFTYLSGVNGPGLQNGDVVSAAIRHNLITVYVNGVQVLQARDRTYTSGSPGMGFFFGGTEAANSDFGFTNYSATDGLSQVPEPSTLILLMSGPAVLVKRMRKR
jgi:hypothetical protein